MRLGEFAKSVDKELQNWALEHSSIKKFGRWSGTSKEVRDMESEVGVISGSKVYCPGCQVKNI